MGGQPRERARPSAPGSSKRCGTPTSAGFETSTCDSAVFGTSAGFRTAAGFGTYGYGSEASSYQEGSETRTGASVKESLSSDSSTADLPVQARFAARQHYRHTGCEGDPKASL